MPSTSYSRLATTHQAFAPPSAASATDDQDEELDAAFDDSEHADEPTERDHLVLSVGSHDHQVPSPCRGEGTSAAPPFPTHNAPGGYDFERDPFEAPVTDPRLPRPRLIGLGNDGVFTNLSAKPTASGISSSQGGGSGGDKEEALPTYDAAALDSAPPYWETTITLPGGMGAYGILGPDDVLVDGLVVGNLFGFAWNLLVSMSFQFIGFLLTYLLHTTHAAKNGSRAGLGITLIQYGLYTRTRASEPGPTPDELARTNGTINGQDWGLFGTPARPDWDGSTSSPVSLDQPEQPKHQMSTVANEWLSYVLIAIGWFLLLGGIVNYYRAVSHVDTTDPLYPFIRF
ncbi:hypothetical protein CROQUDRAFT_39491 [Cronartium quercuum f. sp. fusiforme G11]|uniref:Metal homeostatis protein bsd2 n=1 Tax=Cronartium quercuum f. sp. fusiforme G11 TaxID=708437 RepID=A0A9P6NQC9_9BASI|nr:hypothetical protein CROQUDRAFT_39491 [Cronartium quercuum f. sp. fusiforme G11]